MTNPCDTGICDKSRCHDPDCCGEGSKQTDRIKLSPNNIIIPINQQDEEGDEDGNS